MSYSYEQEIIIANNLVKVALAGETITYKGLSNTHGVTIHYHAGGGFGKYLEEIGKKCKDKLPIISSLVVYQKERIPGEGYFKAFVKGYDEQYDDGTKKAIVEEEQTKVHKIKDWNYLLEQYK